ncbi:hypothetical protein MNB_SM-7-8 [hydrothermal vent metagenome]|uniref:DUF4852 domain-containing protein n=1 Tax=hydrothermal vent metagenome TaxID=652676 RepID=A0A1W1BGW7_9ZZZZ
MKKLILFFFTLFVLSLQAETLDFNVKTDVDKLAYLAYSKDPFAVEENVWGAWFLYYRNHDLYKEVHEDEFELEDASNAYLKKLQKMAKYYNEKFKDHVFSITVPMRFGKYKRKGGYFKIENLTSQNYFTYSGDSMVDWARLSFNNTASSKDYDKVFLPREEAKILLKNRKDAYGNIDRTIHIKFDFKIADIKITDLPTIDGNDLELKVIGKIVKMDYIDQKTGKILKSVVFKK